MVERGTYSERETAPGSSEPGLTLEEAKQRAEGLKRRLEEAQRAKAANLTKQVGERERFIGTLEDISGRLAEARSTLDYFENQEKSGLLVADDDRRTLAELRTLVAELERQEAGLEGAVKALEDQPEVLGKVQEEAMLENVERDAQRELGLLFDALTRRFIEFAERRKALYRRRNELGRTEEEAYRQADKLVRDALARLPEDSKLKGQVARLWNEEYDHPEGWFVEQLQALRVEQGLFRGREKSVLDELLGRDDVFAHRVAVREERHKSEEEADSYIGNNIAELVEPVREFEKKRKQYDGEIVRLSDGKRRLAFPDRWHNAMYKGFSGSGHLTVEDLEKAIEAELREGEKEPERG